MNTENVRKQENDYPPVDYYCSIFDHDTDITKMIGINASNSSGSVTNEDSGTVQSKIVCHQIQGAAAVGSQ